MYRVQKSIVLSSFTIAITWIFLLALGNDAFAIEYTNYTSEKLGIQFEIPSNWEIQEKTSRFESGADIQIKSGTNEFGIFRYDNPEAAFGARDVETATENTLEAFKTSMYGYDVRTIEEPSYLTIDGQKTGTFLITFKNKYEDFSIKGAHQQWNVFVGDHSYQIMNIALPRDFDSPENTEIRNHFINSIKFLDDAEPQQKSRFD